MKQRSPTLEGFRAVFQQPAVPLAEIAWRWTFGVAAIFLLGISLLEYYSFRNLNIPSGIGSHAVESKPTLRSLVGLNLLRVVLTLATAIAGVGAAILAGFASAPADTQPGLVFLLFMPLVLLVWLLWSVLNWFLSLASLFLIEQNNDILGAISAAVDLCRARMGPVLSVGFWFFLAHVCALVVATTIAAFPLAFVRVLPAGVVLGGVLLVMLLYFAVADFLYVGRLAAYLCIIEQPDSPPEPVVTMQPISPVGTDSHRSPVQPASEDDILSDIPLRGPAPQPS